MCYENRAAIPAFQLQEKKIETQSKIREYIQKTGVNQSMALDSDKA